jgi:hypothetical protein
MKHFLIVALTVLCLPTMAAATDETKVTDTKLPDAARCLPGLAMADYLKRAWNEVPVPQGDLRNSNATTLFLSKQGSWTLIERRTDGQACVEASGTKLQFRASLQAGLSQSR